MPPPTTAEEAVRQAETEGLTLLRSDRGSTGYKGARVNSSYKSKPYKAEVQRGGRQVHLGCFATAEEAALCYARTPEAQAAAAAPPAPPPLTAEEAVRQAEAEGLTLLRVEGSRSGFRGVGFDSRAKSKAYTAKVWRGGKLVHLGCFATPEEAALCYARTPEGRAAAAAPPEPPAQPPMTAEEAQRQAETDGLTLLKSARSSTGYKGVAFNPKGKRKPYMATVWRGGKQVTLGYYPTPEEAALHVARASAAQAAAPQPPAASSRKRKAKPEEQPRDVPADVVVIIDGHFVDGGALFS